MTGRRSAVVAPEVLDNDFGMKVAVRYIDTLDADTGGFRLEIRNGPFAARGHLLRQRSDAEFVAIAVQQIEHKEIAGDEYMPVETLARRPQDPGDGVSS